MRDTIPDWAGQYVGIEFASRGRTRESGLDCWGLVRLVYAERYGVTLPDYLGDYSNAEDPRDVAGVVRRATGAGGSWTRVDSPKVGDVAVFRIEGEEAHVGLYIGAGRMLHALRGARSVIEDPSSPLWRPRLVGWFRHSSPVRLLARRSILSPKFEPIEVREGQNLEEMVVAGGFSPDASGLRVYIGDREVDRRHWKHVRPRAGRRVLVAIAPESSGKDALRIIGVLAVVVASIYLGPEVALALGYTGTGTAAAISTATIALAGTLAVNSLIPPPGASLSANTAEALSPTINGTGNDVRPFAPIPVVLGRHRVTPPFGARPYTEVVGDDQYLRCLFVVGYGPLDISDVKIGETPIDEFEGVEIEIREGFADDEPIRLYPNAVREEGLSVALTFSGGWVTRTTEPNSTEISVDVTFPRGVATISNAGERENRSVGIDVEYSPAGVGAWIPANSVEPVDARSIDLRFRTPDVTRIGNGFAGGRIAWSRSGIFPDSPPAYVPSTTGAFSISLSGWLVIDEPGEYRLGFDSTGAADLTVDDRAVASWYGLHGAAGTPDFEPHSRAVNLSRGLHRFRLRASFPDAATASLALGWRRPGSSAWEIIPAASIRRGANAGASSGFAYRSFDVSALESNLNVTAAQTEQIRRTLSWAVPSGQYDVRVRRSTPDATTDREIDLAYWTALRSITTEEPIGVPGLARIALRIKATDQLNGVIDSLNVIAESVLPDWDAASGTWITRATRNPASLYRGVLQHPANRRRVGDHRIDLDSLAVWHEANDEKGFTFDAVFDFAGTVFERLSQVAAMGRASFGMTDGKFSIVRDVAQTTPVQIFTPRNSKDFRGRRAFPDVPHALRVRFLNAAAGYQQDERVVYDDGFDEDSATVFESIELFGCTDADLAWKIGRYYIATARLRPETFEITVGAEQLVCRRGDLVLVNHDVPLLGTGYGRVRQVVDDTAGRPAVIVVDAPVEMEAGKSYAFRFRKADGTVVAANAITNAGEQTAVYLDAPIPVDSPAPEAGDLFAFGERTIETREMILKSIAMGADLVATLTLVDHAPAIHLADVGEIPPYSPGINAPPAYDSGPAAPVIDSIVSDDWAMVRDSAGVLRPRILVYLRREIESSRPAPVSIQARIREVLADGTRSRWVYRSILPVDAGVVDFSNVEEGREYEVAVRYISAAGAYSAWTARDHVVTGHDLVPPDVISFDVVRLADGTRRFSWVLGEIPPDVIGVRIRYSPASSPVPWESMTDLVDGGILEGSSPTDLAAPGSGSWRFAIKMVDAGGLESRNAVFVSKTLGALPAENVAVYADGRSEGWPGTKTRCAVGVRGELFALGARTWDTLPNSFTDWRLWSMEPATSIEYEHEEIDAGFVFDFEPDAVVAVEGDQTATVLFDYSEDGVEWNGYLDLDLFEGKNVRARFVRFKVTVEASATSTVPVLYDFAMILKAPTVTQVLDNVATGSLGTDYRISAGRIFAPISSTLFASIETISVSFNGAGAGWTWEILSKNVDPGPEIRIFNPDGDPQDATIDVTVRGIRSSDGSSTPSRFGVLRFNNRRNSFLLAL